MPSRTDDPMDFAEQPPTSIDPYKVLDLAENAGEDEIKKAYRKAALKHHPDKAQDGDREKAKEMFQEIALAYAILSDPRRRKRYDNTGSTAESLDIEDDDFDWLSFFRDQYYEAITTEMMEKDKANYQESGEQRKALLAAYTQYKGSMGKIYQVTMHSNVLDDDERFRKTIEEAIANGEVEAYDKYTKETEKSKQNRIRAAQRDAKEAKELTNELEKKAKTRQKSKTESGAGEGDLAALIHQRQQTAQARSSKFFEDLEEKYACKDKKGKKRDEPPEEAFEATAKRARKGKAGK